MSLPAKIMVGLQVLSVLVSLVKNGQPREPHDFGMSLASVLIGAALLYWGGFYS